MGSGNSKLGLHMEQYAVYTSSLVSGDVPMFWTHVRACLWRCSNSCVKEPLGARLTPRVRFPMELLILGMVVREVDQPTVI